MDKSDILLCVFSFNMGHAFKNCLEYISINCPGFDVILMDDASNDPLTKSVIETYRPIFKEVFVNESSKNGKKHGNLYDNIQKSCDYARREGYKYIFMIQDDMQFVRPLTETVLLEYQRLFDGDEKVLQVDPRFLRYGKFEIIKELRVYRNNARTSYADVGILHLDRLKKSGWTFRDGERVNSEAMADMGFKRYFPFTPVIMHVPFPQRYRNGKRRREIFPFNRGKYGYHLMTPEEMLAMDSREVSDCPFFRKFLRARNMRLSRLIYFFRKDARVLA